MPKSLQKDQISLGGGPSFAFSLYKTDFSEVLYTILNLNPRRQNTIIHINIRVHFEAFTLQHLVPELLNNAHVENAFQRSNLASIHLTSIAW